MTKSILFVSPFFLLLSYCSLTNEVQLKDKEALYNNCMKTFNDDLKCKDFMAKSEEDLKSSEDKRKDQAAKLSVEQLAGLKLRQELKDTLPGKNNLYVKSLIGEPDEIKFYGERIYWVYTRPICKFRPESDPDDQVTVIFRKVLVERVEHIKPPSAVDEGVGFRKILSPSESNVEKKKMNGLKAE